MLVILLYSCDEQIVVFFCTESLINALVLSNLIEIIDFIDQIR